MTDAPDEPQLDVEALLEQLARSGAEHRQVVALRPSAEQVADAFEGLGRLLSQFGEASRELAALTVGIDPTQKSGWFPLPGSVANADADSLLPSIVEFCQTPRESYHWLDTNPTRNPVDWGLGYVVRCFKTVAESVSAVGVLSSTGRHLRAPLTLMRSIVEASATACFVMDVRVTERERLRRVLNLHLAQTKEALLESEGLDHSAQYATELEEVMEFASFCGFTLRRYKPANWSPPVIASEDQQPSDSTRAIIDEVLPDIGSSIWRNLSAVAHSRGAQTLLYDEFSLAHDLHDWQRTEVVARHGLAVLVVLREMCIRIEAYLGWEFASWSEAIDEMIKQCYVAAGMADGEIRAHLGLPPT